MDENSLLKYNKQYKQANLFLFDYLLIFDKFNFKDYDDQ